VTAYFRWRASQLRQVSEVLMQSAMRLIRPQDIATEGLTTIAQAVRNEVDLLVGGVEHAVQRATVLEEIVHKEISAIERAFGGNEDRIRGLVAGLENQRAALHQAGLIINNDANPLLTRLETSTKTLDGIVGNAHETLARLETSLRDMAGNSAVRGAELPSDAEVCWIAWASWRSKRSDAAAPLSPPAGAPIKVVDCSIASDPNEWLRPAGLGCPVVYKSRGRESSLTGLLGLLI
jgi:hypothetical protein